MHESDVPAVQNLEVAAGAVFATVGMRSVAEDDPPSTSDLKSCILSGLAWAAFESAADTHDAGAAASSAETLAGYLLADVVDGKAHVEQVSVHPDHARKGLGARLIDAAAEEAAAQGITAQTLTTFRDVPWNAPYYARLGFAVVPEHEWGPGMRRRVAEEAAHGLSAWPRVVMQRSLAVHGEVLVSPQEV